jgi:hypothetical protein
MGKYALVSKTKVPVFLFTSVWSFNRLSKVVRVSRGFKHRSITAHNHPKEKWKGPGPSQSGLGMALVDTLGRLSQHCAKRTKLCHKP